MQRLRAALAKQSGMPITRLLKEQEQRVLPAPVVREASRIIPQTGQAVSDTLQARTAAGQPVQQHPERTRRPIQRRVRESS
jgi:hypothetical protein